MSEQEIQNMARLIDLNRQRLEQMQDQVSRLEMVQAEAADVESSLVEMSRISTAVASSQTEEIQNRVMIPFGSGVHLPTSIDTDTTAVIDIGSGIFAEKKPEQAAEIIRTRITDLGIIINELNTEAETIAEKITEMSAEFNLAAQKISGGEPTREVGATPSPKSDNNVTEATDGGGGDEEGDQQKKSRPTRRRGFGGELTLDD